MLLVRAHTRVHANAQGWPIHRQLVDLEAGETNRPGTTLTNATVTTRVCITTASVGERRGLSIFRSIAHKLYRVFEIIVEIVV